METLLITLGAIVAYVVAYHTYGRWLSRKLFKLDGRAVVPAVEMEDGTDFVPTAKSVVFGHHFTSIAGTGPIVGPALAVEAWMIVEAVRVWPHIKGVRESAG
jgi:carbon starvation protein